MSLRFDTRDIDVEEFLEVLEVENITKATEEEFKFSCPFPGHQHGDQNPSAYMNIDTTAWMCHGCKRRGNAVTFLAEHEMVSIMLATRWLHERYGGVGSDPDAYSARAELERLWEKNEREDAPLVDPKLDPEIIYDYAVDWRAVAESDSPPPWGEYMLDRGFEFATLNEWDIGYCEETNRVVIPVRDVEGDLIGFKGRAWRDEHKPKYLVLSPHGMDRYHVALNVFGLDAALLNQERELIVCEGELNAIALWQMGYYNAVAVNGSNFSDRQAFLLRNHADKVVVWFDPNDAGYDGILRVVNALSDYMPVDVVPDSEQDPADLMKAGDEDSVRELLYSAHSALGLLLGSHD